MNSHILSRSPTPAKKTTPSIAIPGLRHGSQLHYRRRQLEIGIDAVAEAHDPSLGPILNQARCAILRFHTFQAERAKTSRQDEHCQTGWCMGTLGDGRLAGGSLSELRQRP